jgi:hypothetical protein
MNVGLAEQTRVMQDNRQARTRTPYRADSWNENMNRAFCPLSSILETSQAVQRRGGKTS